MSTRESLKSPGELSRLRQEDWLKVKSDILKKRTASAVTTAEDTERSRSAPDRARYARHSARSAKKRGPAHLLLKVAALLLDRKSTRLNSSHVAISYAVFCLKKKNKRREKRR